MSKILNIVSNVYSNGEGTITYDGQIEEIPNELFKNNTKLTTLTLPDNVRKIGSHIIYGCNNLTTIYYNNVTYTINNIDILEELLTNNDCEYQDDSFELGFTKTYFIIGTSLIGGDDVIS